MSMAKCLLTYTFTSSFSEDELNQERCRLVRNFSETTSGDKWELEILSFSRLSLTLLTGNNDDCTFYFKISLLDERRQQLTVIGWKRFWLCETFTIDNWAFFDSAIIITVAVMKVPTLWTSAELTTLFKTETFGNVTIECADGEKFYCHKDILAAKSLVFAKMFNVEMKESVENRVEIKDFSSNVISALLKFAYRGDCGDLSGIADRLYVAADRYQLEQLKLACAAELIVNLNVGSIVSTLQLAQLYKDESLAAGCVDYMASHKSNLSLVEVLAKASKNQ